MLELQKMGFEIEAEWDSASMKIAKPYLSFKGDGSIRVCNKCEYLLQGYEGVTKPFEADNTYIRSIKDLFDGLQEQKRTGHYHYNRTCGFHVHTSYNEKFPAEIMSARFVTHFIAEFQKQFPIEYNKRKSASYARIPKEIKDNIGGRDKKCIHYSKLQEKADKSIVTHERYRAVNIYPALGRHKTIEFRIFPSTEPDTMYRLLKFTRDTINNYLAKDTFSVVFEKKLVAGTGRKNYKLDDKVDVIERPKRTSITSEVGKSEAIEYSMTAENTALSGEIEQSGIPVEVPIIPYELRTCENDESNCNVCDCCEVCREHTEECECHICEGCSYCIVCSDCECVEDCECGCCTDNH